MKSQINQWLRQNGITGQKQTRQASWRHAELSRKDPTYSEEAQELQDEVGSIPCAQSKQEAYHITHFVNAVMLTLLRPDKAYDLNEQIAGPINNQVAQVTDDKNECDMYKTLLYKHLWQVIQNYGKTEKTQTTARRLQGIEERIRRLELYTGVDDESQDSI